MCGRSLCELCPDPCNGLDEQHSHTGAWGVKLCHDCGTRRALEGRLELYDEDSKAQISFSEVRQRTVLVDNEYLGMESGQCRDMVSSVDFEVGSHFQVGSAIPGSFAFRGWFSRIFDRSSYLSIDQDWVGRLGRF